MGAWPQAMETPGWGKGSLCSSTESATELCPPLHSLLLPLPQACMSTEWSQPDTTVSWPGLQGMNSPYLKYQDPSPYGENKDCNISYSSSVPTPAFHADSFSSFRWNKKRGKSHAWAMEKRICMLIIIPSTYTAYSCLTLSHFILKKFHFKNELKSRRSIICWYPYKKTEGQRGAGIITLHRFSTWTLVMTPLHHSCISAEMLEGVTGAKGVGQSLVCFVASRKVSQWFLNFTQNQKHLNTLITRGKGVGSYKG